MKLTPDGRDLQWFGGATQAGVPGPGRDAPQAGSPSLPTLASAAQVDRSKPLAVVLATAVSQTAGARARRSGGAPAVVYQPYGTGRVVVVEGSGMWRWAFLPPKYKGRRRSTRRSGTACCGG